MCAVEYRMLEILNLDDIEKCWPHWLRLKQYFKIFLSAAGFEKLAKTRKASILLNCAGQQVHELYFNVLKTDDKVKFEEILIIFLVKWRKQSKLVGNSDTEIYFSIVVTYCASVIDFPFPFSIMSLSQNLNTRCNVIL